MDGRSQDWTQRTLVTAALLTLCVVARAADGTAAPKPASAAEPAAKAAPAAATAAAASAPLKLRADHVTGTVSDMDRAVRWYQEVLGFHVDQRGTRGQLKFAEMSIPGFGVALVQPPGTIQPRPAGARGAEWTYLVFTVADVPATCATLKARGANAHTRDGSPFSDYCIFEDTEGNQLEIMQEKR